MHPAIDVNNLNDLYAEVSRRADTTGTSINVAEVSLGRGIDVAKGK